MLAVKAVYEDGQVKWPRSLALKGRHELIVTFLDGEPLLLDQGDSSDQSQQPAPELVPLPELTGRIPDGWKDAIYG